MLRLKNNKIAFIDTEIRSFAQDEKYRSIARVFADSSEFSPDTSFSEAGLKHIFLQILDCAPQKRLYNDIYTTLKSSEDTMTWDYVSFFKETFPKPE